jgi:hypothetical protein
MNIRTLRKKLAEKSIIWVKSGTADMDSRFKPDTEDGKNYTMVFIPKYGVLQIDNGTSEEVKIKMSERQYRNLFSDYGYTKELVV